MVIGGLSVLIRKLLYFKSWPMRWEATVDDLYASLTSEGVLLWSLIQLLAWSLYLLPCLFGQDGVKRPWSNITELCWIWTDRNQYWPLGQLSCLTHPYLVMVLSSQVLLGQPQTPWRQELSVATSSDTWAVHSSWATHSSRLEGSGMERKTCCRPFHRIW